MGEYGLLSEGKDEKGVVAGRTRAVLPRQRGRFQQSKEQVNRHENGGGGSDMGKSSRICLCKFACWEGL